MDIASQEDIKLIPLGGQEQVGLTMMVVQYKDDIVVLDLGLEFPEDGMYGVDYIVPNTAYLEERKENIKGVIISHGNLDHFGGTPYMIEKLGFPTIYTGELTKRLIEKNLEEFGLLDRVNFKVIDAYSENFQLGPFEIELFHVNHNIPDSMGVAFHTPSGTIVHSGDFKFDNTPIYEPPADYGKIAGLGNRGVLMACCDSTNALVPGYSMSEAMVSSQLDTLIGSSTGRVIVSTFSTLIYRIQKIIELAEKFHRKVAFLGRSMEKSFEICRELGYITGPDTLFISASEVDQFPDHNVLIISTGAQATQYSALTLASRREHRILKIREGDTVILSSSVVPGNEKAVENLLQGLVSQGAKTYQHEIMGVHTGGHAQQEELKLMLNLLRPRYFMPVMGMQHMLATHGALAQDVGVPRENIILASNGDVISVNENRGKVTSSVQADPIYITRGQSLNVSKGLIRERGNMIKDGVIVVSLMIDEFSGEILSDIKVESLGVMDWDDFEFIEGDIVEAVRSVEELPDVDTPSIDLYRKRVVKAVRSYFSKEYNVRPMIRAIVHSM